MNYLLNRLKANREDGKAWELNDLDKPIFVRLLKPLQKIRQFFLKPKLQLKVLIVDNKDSFTYNLKHYINQFTDDIDVLRGDVLDFDNIMNYDKI